nr:RAMP superfamily CRISPR-associated protein [Fusobacterium gastrosuis]
MKVDYTIELLLPTVTASIGTIGKDIDIAVKRDKNNKPYFNAKHIKGILRERVYQYKRALGVNEKDTEKFIEAYFGKEGNYIKDDNLKKVRFSNLKLKNEKNFNENKDISNRYGIKIDRRTRSTVDNSLFNYEFLKQGLIFTGELEFDINTTKEDFRFILACLFHLNFIGGLKSRGLGKVEVKIENLGIDKLDTIVDSFFKKANLKDELKPLGELEKYSYTLMLEEPIILKEKEIGNYIESRTDLQGSTVRGALIGAFIKAGRNLEDLLKIEVFSASSGEIKLASKFKTKYPINTETKDFKYIDKAINLAKEYKGIKLERANLKELEISGNEMTVKINQKTKSAEDGMLFNTEQIFFDKELKGEASLPKNLIDLNKEYEIYLGKFKFKGYGKAKIIFSEYKRENKECLEKRIEKFNKDVNFLKKEDMNLITFDLLSDLILPFNEIHDIGIQFKQLLDIEEIRFSPERSFINNSKLEGYNIINNSRKVDELIINKGSVLTYFINDYRKVKDKLENIEKIGIGLRKNEGFGRISVCSDRGDK